MKTTQKCKRLKVNGTCLHVHGLKVLTFQNVWIWTGNPVKGTVEIPWLIWAAETAEKWKYLIPIAIEASLCQKIQSQNLWIWTGNSVHICPYWYEHSKQLRARNRNILEMNSTSLHKEIPPPVNLNWRELLIPTAEIARYIS